MRIILFRLLFVCLALLLLMDNGELLAQCAITGSISATDQSYNGKRLDRPTANNAPLATCAVPKTCPGPYSGTATAAVGMRYYDTYPFANNTSAPVCISLTYTSTCGAGVVASVYLNSFDPTDLCQNYIASFTNTDPGKQISFIVPANSSYVIVAMNVGAGQFCSSYTLMLQTSVPDTPPAISSLAASGPVGCGLPAQLTGTASGQSFVFIGPNGYVFSNVFRETGVHPIIAQGITTPGQYQLMAYNNVNGSSCVTEVRTITVEGTGCSDNKAIQPPGSTDLGYDIRE